MNLLKLTIPMVLVVSMLAGGCDRVQRLEAQNRALSERLELTQSERDQARAELVNLGSGMTTKDSAIAARDMTIDELRADNERKAQALINLKELYKKELDKKPSELVDPRAPLPAKVNAALTAFADKNPNMVEFNKDIGMLKFKSDFTFGLGSATPNATAVAAMAKLVEVLNTEDAVDFSVYVAGHTDDVPVVRTKPMHPNNWYLSVHRAVGVTKVLEAAGLDSSRICAMGFGEWHPIEPNKPGKKGSAKNRRVELWIVPSGAFIQTGVAPMPAE